MRKFDLRSNWFFVKDFHSFSLQTADSHSTASANPLSYFRSRIIPNLQLNGFEKFSFHTSQIDNECEEILKHALITHGWFCNSSGLVLRIVLI